VTTPALPADQRPFDFTPIDTGDLPLTPTRDRNIAAAAWRQAPAELRALGHGLDGDPEPAYKRRIGSWLLWRAGPAVDADARYLAMHLFALLPDGTGHGAGPSGTVHTRFRTWKEDLRDHP
jgi:hypothetical protein